MNTLTLTVDRQVDHQKLRVQLLELSKTYHVICMNPVVYAACRKYGRDQLSILSSTDTLESIPFYWFAFALGVQGAFYREDSDLPEDSEHLVHYSPHDLIRNGHVDWAMIVQRKEIPDHILRVSVRLGDPWQDIPLEA